MKSRKHERAKTRKRTMNDFVFAGSLWCALLISQVRLAHVLPRRVGHRSARFETQRRFEMLARTRTVAHAEEHLSQERMRLRGIPFQEDL